MMTNTASALESRETDHDAGAAEFQELARREWENARCCALERLTRESERGERKRMEE
jgi:hypothetical protein